VFVLSRIMRNATSQGIKVLFLSLRNADRSPVTKARRLEPTATLDRPDLHEDVTLIAQKTYQCVRLVTNYAQCDLAGD
jgi:hypothetical protein